MNLHRFRVPLTGVCIALLVTFPFADVRASHNEGTSRTNSSVSRADQRATAAAERKVKKLGSRIEKKLRVPVIGVSVSALTDTWGDARSGGRTHEGIDIIAPRGALVVSPTKAIVTRIGKNELGGIVVYTGNPGNERFYYAHLDRVAKGLKVGQELKPGDLIGYVGNTGNASGTVPHLHLGIYKRGAHNPFPRITRTFTAEEQKSILAKEVMRAKRELAAKD